MTDEPSSPPAEPAAPQNWQIWACLDVLNDIQEQIRFADSKAGFIAAFNVLLFGFVANHVDKLRTLCGNKTLATGMVTLAIVLAACYLVAMVATFAMVVLCIVSRFGTRMRQSRVFFAQIAEQYGKDHQRYSRELAAMTNGQWLDELGAQVVEVSRLATLKHKYVRWAAYGTMVSVSLWVAALVTIVAAIWIESP